MYGQDFYITSVHLFHNTVLAITVIGNVLRIVERSGEILLTIPRTEALRVSIQSLLLDLIVCITAFRS